MRKLLFSIRKSDFEIQTFCSGGKGGQHQNKTESGVRLIHKASGAVGECRNFRSQHQNKKEALYRLADSEKFKKWHKTEVSRKQGLLVDLETWVDKQLKPENIKIEVKDGNGKWVILEEGEKND